MREDIRPGQTGTYGTPEPQPIAPHDTPRPMPAAGADADTGTDLEPDMGPDMGTDIEPDTGPDMGTDVEPDMGPDTGGTSADTAAVLFGGDEVDRFRDRWRELQADFVDDPMGAVRGADHLVDEVMRSLSEVVAAHKHDLEGEWQAGGTGETEELRVALRHYRTFFDQLLNA